MDESRVYEVLGIGKTADEQKIREAYRQKLRLVNPEDDPEGFKQLRESYERALQLLTQKEGEAEEIDDTPSGRFVQKAAQIYGSMRGRQDAAAWKQLFMEPEFLDLWEEENCREKLMDFLMRHCYFPTQVWKVLEEGLQITAEKEKLYEKFPRDFIDFCIKKIERGEDFEFDQLTGPDNADLDGWIFLFAKAGREEGEKNYAAMAETIAQAKEKGISHPGLCMMEARMLFATGEPKAADRIVEALLEGEFAGALNVQYQTAEYFWEGGQKERAAQGYLQIRAASAKHYMANRRLAQWHLLREEWEQAKECVNVILAYPLDDEGKELVNEINAGLEHFLLEKIEKEPDNLKARMDLGWCYLQDEMPQKTIALMENIEVKAGQEKDFVNLMGKVYYYGAQYEKAVPLICRWLVLLQEQMPDEGQEREDDQERMATAHSLLSQIKLEQAQKAKGDAKDKLFEEVLSELGAAKEAHYNPGQDYACASAYLEWGKFEECRKICAELRLRYPDFHAAVILHQKASAKLFDAGAVIGDYFALRQMQPDYAGAYELAAEVYHNVKRTQDLDSLLKDAEEAGVMTARLKRYRFYRMADNAQKKEELLKALDYAREVSKEGENQDWSGIEKADFIAERARNYWRLDANETALELIDQAIALFPDRMMYTYIKAGIKKDQKEYAQALSLYQSCRADYDQTAHYYANVGECQYRLNRIEEALPNLKKAVEINPDNPACCTWIERIYRVLMERENSLSYMDEALQYADLMILHRGDSFDYVEKGLLYVLAQEYETAAAEFVKAIQADPKDPFSYSNLARMYRLLNRLPEAEEQAKLAVANLENDPAPYHYEMLGRVYWQMHRYTEALDAFGKNWERFPERREGFLGSMVSICSEAGDWKRAVALLQDFYREQGKQYVKKIVEVYCCAGYFKQAAKFVHQYYRGAGFGKEEYEKLLADICWHQGDLENAAKHITQSLGAAQVQGELYPTLCRRAADIFFFAGDKRQASHWSREALSYYRLNGGFASRLNALDDRLQNMYELGLLQLYAGNVGTAQALADEMRPHPRCLGCSRSCCTDAAELEAGVYAAKGMYAKAVALYREILEESPADQDVRTKLALLEKRAETAIEG